MSTEAPEGVTDGDQTKSEGLGSNCGARAFRRGSGANTFHLRGCLLELGGWHYYVARSGCREPQPVLSHEVARRRRFRDDRGRREEPVSAYRIHLSHRRAFWTANQRRSDAPIVRAVLADPPPYAGK